MNVAGSHVAIVTGGATGIGGAIARRLAADGARVLIADINGELAAENADRIRSDGGTAVAIYADVADHSSIQAMIRDAVDRWGRLDILVNNAFPATEALLGGAEEVTEDQWVLGRSLLLDSLFFGANLSLLEDRWSVWGNV